MKDNELRKIDWSRRSESERERYEYYRSLGYDERTSTVLALFTYGQRKYDDVEIDVIYEKLLGLKGMAGDAEMDGDDPDDESMDDDNFDDEYNDGLLAGNAPELYAAAAPCCIEDAEETVCDAGDASVSSGLHYCLADSVEDDYGSYGILNSTLKGSPSFPRTIVSMMSMADPEADPATDEYEPIEEKNFRSVTENMTSTFRMTTNTASAGVVLNQLRADRRIDMSMVRIEEMLNYFRYKSVVPETEKFRISCELMPATAGKKLLYINVQGKEEIKSSQNIVILLDVSGSMWDETIQTQAMVATIISKLKPGDKISLVTYSSRDEVIFRGMEIRGEKDKIKALEKFLGIEVDGYTYGSAGIEKAYQIGKEEFIDGGNNQVILITDGDLNFGITNKGGLEELIEEKKKSNLFLSVIGTGLDNYKDDKLEVLSKHGNGVYRTVNNLADVRKCINAEYTSLVNIIAKDVKAQVEFNPEVVESYRLLGFENREISHEDFANDKVISEPFGSGGYGVALYELVLRDGTKPVESGYKYAKVVTTGSSELGTVRVRFKEPLADTSEEIEYVIPSAEAGYTDNLRLAYVVYVCAEKLRGSDKISEQDVELAKKLCDEVGEEIKEMNRDDFYKLPEILNRSADELNVGIHSMDPFEW